MLRRTFSVIAIAMCALFVMIQNRVAAQGPEPPTTVPSQVIFGLPFTYQGQLKKGNAPITGDCSMAFRLYDDWSEGNQIAYPITVTVSVSGGLFAVPLDFGSKALTGDTRWLGIWVKCPGDWMYADLGRQLITAAPYALTLQSGAVISANLAGAAILNVANTNSSTSGGNAISAINYSGDAWQPAIYGENKGTSAGVYGRSDGGNAVVGWNQSNSWGGVYGNNIGEGYGVRGESTTGVGVYGWNHSYSGNRNFNGVGVLGIGAMTGVLGHGEYGVVGYSAAKVGVEGTSEAGIGVRAQSNGAGYDGAALNVENGNEYGIASYMKNNSAYPTAEYDQLGTGRVLDLQNNGDAAGTGGGDFITAYSGDLDMQFRVESSGTVRSDVGFFTPAADVAEMLPAVDGLEPGDVLIIGDDSQLTRSTQPYQASVVGVYSTQPGFVGGSPIDGPITGAIPLAIVGIVPVKVSAENGAIHSGDLLVASSLPGHAMRAGSNPPVGTVIGKALEKFDASHKTGIIKMLVTLR
jgi:hypothetical protein